MSDEHEFRYTNLENGLDFLLRALEYLEGEPTHRDIKYAVLHFHSGIELVLKERLRREHWSLIFEKPEEATKEKYENGDFNSVSWVTCIKRLHGICGIKLSDSDNIALNILKNKRNRLEHFGIVDNAYAVKSSTVPVLNFAIDFINDELKQETMSETEQQLLQQIRDNLSNFTDFVNIRLTKLSSVLESYEGRVVTCPHCLQDTWAVDSELNCLFCGHKQPEVSTAITEYIENVLGITFDPIFGDTDWPIYHCPNCKKNSLVDISSKEQFNKPIYICFSCGEKWSLEELNFCTSCGQLFVSNGRAVCDDCFNWSLRRND